MSSPWSFPRAATDPQMRPMSFRSAPAMVAVSPTNPRTRSNSRPGLIPAATMTAASDAASPIPNAVPFTDLRAEFMICSTVPASCPRPDSLARALSMAVSRSKPFHRAVPKAAVTARPVACAPLTRTPPIAAFAFCPKSSPVAFAALPSCSVNFPESAMISMIA